MKLLIAADKTRFHNLKQFADELVKYGIEYKLIDDSDIYDAPNILHKYSRWSAICGKRKSRCTSITLNPAAISGSMTEEKLLPLSH